MIGKTIKGKYKIVDKIGEGSLATVYAARDIDGNRFVALKIIHPDLAGEHCFAHRFHRDAKLLTKLDSPHAVKVFDFGTEADLHFIVMEYVQGKTLSAVLESEGPLEIERALDITRQVARCLQEAQDAGIAHHNIRPSNIMITPEGQVKVMDFGVVAGSGRSTPSGSGIAGTPYYLAPEQTEGVKVDIRADIYSLGVTFFEMLSGERPYDAENAKDIVLKHLQEPIPSLQEFNEEIPTEVDKLVTKCLAKDPADRFQTPEDLIEAVNEALGQMEDALVGQTLGQYRLIERLGRGGMATVYRAYQPSLDRYVAVKVLPTSLAHDPDFTVRFRREARSIARLDHPNILPVHDYGQEGELSYIVMRYVPGGTLKERLGQPLDLDTTLGIIAQAGRALDYAHQRGIVHRDVKPGNILMAEGSWALLSDFGLAKIVEASVKITKTGTVGTPDYMSPEQAEGTEVDARSDIYSLGIVLFEMLTGRVPFKADTPLAVLLKHREDPPPLPREINPDIPQAVELVILKALAKAPEDRYKRVEKMVEALKKAVEEARAAERRPKQVSLVEEEEAPFWRRVPVWAWSVAIGMVILLAVGGVFMAGRGEKVKPTPVVVQATTPDTTVAPGLGSPTAGSEVPAVASPTSTPMQATPTPPPTVALAATQTALAAEVMATVLAEASATADAFTPTPTDTPTLTQTPVPSTATATHTPGAPTPTPVPTAVPQLAGPIALTIYLRDTHTETGFAVLSGDQPNGGMIYEEGRFVYGEAAVQIGDIVYHFDKPEVEPGEPAQLPDPWQVEFEFAEELAVHTGNQAGFEPKKAQFWVGTLDGSSAVGKDNPYSLTMRLYEGDELRESIQIFFTVQDAPEGGGGGEEGGGGGGSEKPEPD